MPRRNSVLIARKISVILLVSLGVIVLLTGLLLEAAPEGPRSGLAVSLGLTKEDWTLIHVYAGFALAGAAVVHAYTNYRGILYHTGLQALAKKLRSRRAKTGK